MSMPLDLYVIRHGESEANVIVQAGEQGDNSLYTQDNVTVPDRSWRLTATGRKQADCIGRWLVSQQQLFGDFMLALMLTIEDLADEEFLHRADSDDWKITNCTCLHYTRRDPETGRTSKRVRWEQTARPVLDETTGRWEVKVEPWREFKRPYLSNGDLVDVVQAVDPHLLEYYGK